MERFCEGTDDSHNNRRMTERERERDREIEREGTL